MELISLFTNFTASSVINLMGNLIPESTCVEVENPGYEFSTFGFDIKTDITYIAWAVLFLPMIFISYLITRAFGKISGNYICVPFLSSGSTKNKSNYEDALHFTGFVIKIKVIFKAATLSG